VSAGSPKPIVEAVVIDSDLQGRNVVKNYLTAQGIQIAAVADDMASGLHLVRGIRHGILIMELPASPAETLEAVRRLRNDQPQLGIILTAAEVSPDLILRSMRAGAQEFLPRPLDIRELGEAVNRLAGLLAVSPGANHNGGRIIAVFSCKGGAGVTSIAANVAVSLARQGGPKTALVDFDFQMGDAALMLDLRPAHTLAEVATGPFDETKLRGMLAAHGSGLFVLEGPERLEDSDKVSPAHVVELLGMLKRMFAYVIVDAGRVFEGRTLEVLNAADVILVVAAQNISTVRNVRRGLDLLQELGCPAERVRLLVNRYHKRSQVSLEAVEETVGKEAFWRLPSDERVMNAAIDAGVPVVAHAPRSELARSLARLAHELTSLEIVVPPVPGSEVSKP